MCRKGSESKSRFKEAAKSVFSFAKDLAPILQLAIEILKLLLEQF